MCLIAGFVVSQRDRCARDVIAAMREQSPRRNPRTFGGWQQRLVGSAVLMASGSVGEHAITLVVADSVTAFLDTVSDPRRWVILASDPERFSERIRDRSWTVPCGDVVDAHASRLVSRANQIVADFVIHGEERLREQCAPQGPERGTRRLLSPRPPSGRVQQFAAALSGS